MESKQQPYLIITDNCWGTEYYKNSGIPYETPFVNLFLPPASYLKLLEDIDAALDLPINFTDSPKQWMPETKYPIGLLGEDIELHFLHYDSEEEAKAKWARRVQRYKLAKDRGARILFKMCDCCGATPDDLKKFHSLPIVKANFNISFSTQYLPLENNVRAIRKGKALNGLKLFRRRHFYFNFIHWTKTGEIKKHPLTYLRSLSEIL